MDHEPPFLAHLRRIIPCRSVMEQAILRQFLYALYDGKLFVVGVDEDPLPVFWQPHRVVTGMYHVAHELVNKKVTPVGVMVGHPTQLIADDWENLRAVVNGCYQQLLAEERIMPEGVLVPVSLHATVLLTAIPNGKPGEDEVESVFLFHQGLSQLQGMSLLYQGMNLWEDNHIPANQFGAQRLN